MSSALLVHHGKRLQLAHVLVDLQFVRVVRIVGLLLLLDELRLLVGLRIHKHLRELRLVHRCNLRLFLCVCDVNATDLRWRWGARASERSNNLYRLRTWHARCRIRLSNSLLLQLFDHRHRRHNGCELHLLHRLWRRSLMHLGDWLRVLDRLRGLRHRRKQNLLAMVWILWLLWVLRKIQRLKVV